MDSDDFRRSELYSADVDAVLRPRMVILRLIYDKFKGKRAYHEGVDEMPISHWTTFVTKMYLVNKEFTIRKARIIFAISRLGGVDDYAQQVKAKRFKTIFILFTFSLRRRLRPTGEGYTL